MALLVLGLAGFYWGKGQLGTGALHRSSADVLNLSGLEAAYYDAIQLAWGWCVLFLGAGLVIHGAVLAARGEAAQPARAWLRRPEAVWVGVARGFGLTTRIRLASCAGFRVGGVERNLLRRFPRDKPGVLSIGEFE